MPLLYDTGHSRADLEARYFHAKRDGDLAAVQRALTLVELVAMDAPGKSSWSSFKAYVENELDVSYATARKELTLGKALREYEELADAFADGSLCKTKALVLAEVMVKEHAQAWVEYAKTHSVKDLRKAARGRQGKAPDADRNRRGMYVPSYPVGKVGPVTDRLLQVAKHKTEREQNRALSMDAFLADLCKGRLESEPDGSDPGRKAVNNDFYRITTRVGEEGALELKGEDGAFEPIDLKEWLQAKEEDLSDDALADLRDLCERALVRRGSRLACTQRSDHKELCPIDTLLYFADELDPENARPDLPFEDRALPLSSAEATRVIERDGQCLNCGSTCDLHAHHLRFRRKGGGNALENLITLCLNCHARVHARELVALGPASQARFVAVQPTYKPPPRRAEFVTPRPEPEPEPEPVSEPASEPAAEPPGAEVPAERLSDIVGQPGLTAVLEHEVAVARTTGQQARDLLLLGISGQGKTHTARTLAGELGVGLLQVEGPSLQAVPDLLARLRRVPAGGVLFVDELQRVPRKLQELLFQVLDYGTLDWDDRQWRFPSFTLVAATTHEDQVCGALLSRMRTYRLELTSRADLAEIVDRLATKRGYTIRPEAALALAGAARSTPRVAKDLLHSACGAAQLAQRKEVTLEDVQQGLALEGVDPDGVNRDDRRVLAALAVTGRPLGLRTLACQAAIRPEAIRRLHEPFLLREGLIEIVPGRGRALTPQGRARASVSTSTRPSRPARATPSDGSGPEWCP